MDDPEEIALSGPQTPPHALIIEDQEAVIVLIEIVLQGEGYKTVICTRGDQAIAYLQDNTPNLILLDCYLPDISGEQILDWIDGQPRLQETKIVAMSGDWDFSDQMTKRTVALLRKPFNFYELRKIAVKFKSEAD